ncbi:Uncharacterised protein [Vibrio cholerae]|nr:Uncharacterised protein [Vibrio cholerae]
MNTSWPSRSIARRRRRNPSYCSSPSSLRASNRSLRFMGTLAWVKNSRMYSRLGIGLS